MARGPEFKNYVRSQTAEQRINAAKKVIEDLTYRIQSILQIHASNEIVVYSPKIAEQIDVSDAASSFNTLRDSLFEIEIIKLLAIWDKPAKNSV